MPLPTPRSLFLLAGALIVWARTAGGQGASPSDGAALGLRAIGAFGLHVGQASIQRGVRGHEAGATLDLGHLRSRRVRVGAEVSFLRSEQYSEYILTADRTFRDVFYDLSGHAQVQWLLRDPGRRLVPSVSVGAGVHTLTSSFGIVNLDRRYNTNVFGVRAAAGVRYRVGASRRHAITAEASALAAREVNRRALRMGGEWLFGDLK